MGRLVGSWMFVGVDVDAEIGVGVVAGEGVGSTVVGVLLVGSGVGVGVLSIGGVGAGVGVAGGQDAYSFTMKSCSCPSFMWPVPQSKCPFCPFILIVTSTHGLDSE